MSSSLTILLVDGEPILRRATALMLAGRGARVDAVATAEEAAIACAARGYDVAILDVASGGPSASELLRCVVRSARRPKRVVVCADAPLARAEAIECAAVLSKPYPFDRLLDAVFVDAYSAPRPAAWRSSAARLRTTMRRRSNAMS